MEIEFNLTPQDFEAFVRYQRKYLPRSKNKFRPRALSLIWLPLSVIIIAYYLINDRFHQRFELLLFLVFGFMFGCTIAIVLLLRLIRVAIVRSTKDLYEDEHSRWMFSRRRVAIDPEGVAINWEYIAELIRWPVIWCIRVTNDHAYLFFSRNNAQIVPRRAFRDQRHFDEFIALARQYQRGSDHKESKSDEILDALPARSTDITLPRRP